MQMQQPDKSWKNIFSGGLKNQTSETHLGMEKIFLFCCTENLALVSFLGQFSEEYLLYHESQESTINNQKWNKTGICFWFFENSVLKFLQLWLRVNSGISTAYFWTVWSSLQKLHCLNFHFFRHCPGFHFYPRTWLAGIKFGLYTEISKMNRTYYKVTILLQANQHFFIFSDLDYFKTVNWEMISEPIVSIPGTKPHYL